MTLDRFNDIATPGNFQSDIQRASGYKPITESDLTKAYAQYSEQGVKFGDIKKNATDTELFQKAKEVVLAWWDKQHQPSTPTDGTPPGTNPDGSPIVSPPPAGTGGTTGGGTATGSGSGSTGATMPNTALGTGGPAGDLPHIYTAVEQAAMALGTQRGALIAEKAEPTAFAPLTTTQASAILKSVGAPTTWKPPATALASEATLKQWIVATAQKAQLVLSPYALPQFTTAYIQTVMNNLGVTGITPASVPVGYRTSITALTNYLLAKKAAYSMMTTSYISKMGG